MNNFSCLLLYKKAVHSSSKRKNECSKTKKGFGPASRFFEGGFEPASALIIREVNMRYKRGFDY